MRRAGIAAVLLLGLVQTGCSGSSSVASPAPVGAVSPSASLVPASPSADPSIAGSAAAYRVAADAYNRTVQKLLRDVDSRILSERMTRKLATHFEAMARAEKTFAAAIRKVTFPTGLRTHIEALLAATDAAAALDLKTSRTPIGSQVDIAATTLADRRSSIVADLVRRDFKVLGLDL
jgi:hypothetical protein